jgi:predicted transcriptional regulator of viral defense system
VVKTAQRVRASSQRLADADYLVAHAPIESLGWGMDHDWRHDRRVAAADPARTVVDTLDETRLTGGIRLVAEILSTYAEEGDGALLIDYGDRMRHRSLYKRFANLAEDLGLDRFDAVDACPARSGSGVILLDPGGPRSGACSSRWDFGSTSRCNRQSLSPLHRYDVPHLRCQHDRGPCRDEREFAQSSLVPANNQSLPTFGLGPIE